MTPLTRTMNRYHLTAIYLLGFGTAAGVWESWYLGIGWIGMAAMFALCEDER